MSWKYNTLEHHGILGQKWGIRRFQNPDGSLTAAGRARYQNSDGSLKPEAERHIRDNLWKGLDGSKSERIKLGNKMHSELQSTKEAQAYNDLIKKRGVAIKDGKGNVKGYKLSYLTDDWSDPEKVMDQIVKDTEVEAAYHAKDVEITNKYLREWGGALLKDLGYEDTESGRDFLIKKGIIGEYS